MPYLKIQTNMTAAPDERKALLAAASRTVAEIVGKPERYVMVSLETGVPMLFAGVDTPCAYLELKSIGLPEGRTADFSRALSGLMGETLGIAEDRVYIEFGKAEPHLWGWNGGTF